MHVINSTVGKLFVEALIKKYEAEIAEANATLYAYFENITAIGEHSDLLAEHAKWIEKLDAATSKLETLKKNYGTGFKAERV